MSLMAQSVAEPEPETGGLNLPKGFVLTPSLGMSAFYDDNVFVTPSSPQGSGGGRLSAGVGVSFPMGEHSGFAASYTGSVERFGQLPDLKDFPAAQSASAAVDWQAGRRTNLSLFGSYGLSRRPADLLVDTGLQFARSPTETYSTGVGVTRQVGRDTHLGFSYRYNVLVSARLVREERPSESWTASLSTSLGRRTSLSVSGGVRNIEGSFPATYSVSLSHSWRRSSMSLAYSRGTYLIPTPERTSDSESLGAGYSLSLGRLSLGVSPRVSQNATDVRLVRTFSVGATAALPFGRWVSVSAHYQGSIQQVEQSLQPGLQRNRQLSHNMISVGISVSRPFRLR
jgi:outer membrane usher protein FimD/PapC